MVSSIIFTTFFIAVCLRSSANVKCEDFDCKDDNDFVSAAQTLLTGAVPIIIKENEQKPNPLEDDHIKQSGIADYIKNNFENIVFVTASKCPITDSQLHNDKPKSERLYPAFVMMKRDNIVNQNKPIHLKSESYDEILQLKNRADHLFSTRTPEYSVSKLIQAKMWTTAVGSSRKRSLEVGQSSGTQAPNPVTTGTTTDIYPPPQRPRIIPPTPVPTAPTSNIPMRPHTPVTMNLLETVGRGSANPNPSDSSNSDPWTSESSDDLN